jgi:nucleoside-diphosphate-sugar epimerase
MTKSLAILGGAGAIGRAVTKAALSEKWHVTVLDLKKTVDQYPVPEGANVKYIDLFDEKTYGFSSRSVREYRWICECSRLHFPNETSSKYRT